MIAPSLGKTGYM
uniref:Uncharacterized protein n=1 Tax=Anguilla anguilla TaxID=7936 RepID=A0A0E9RFB3_ANGAN